jgi:hypothetical protein
MRETKIEIQKMKLTGKTPSGRKVQIISRSLPWTAEKIWTLAQGNCIWLNGTFEECQAMFNKVTTEGYRTSEGEIL